MKQRKHVVIKILSILALIYLSIFIPWTILLYTFTSYFIHEYAKSDPVSTVWLTNRSSYEHVAEILTQLGYRFEPWDNKTFAGTLLIFGDVRPVYPYIKEYASSPVVYTSAFDCIICLGATVHSLANSLLLLAVYSTALAVISAVAVRKGVLSWRGAALASAAPPLVLYLSEVLYILATSFILPHSSLDYRGVLPFLTAPFTPILIVTLTKWSLAKWRR